MAIRTSLKKAIAGSLGRLTGRHVALLPPEAADGERLIHLRSPYRVAGNALSISLTDARRGSLSAELLGYDGHFPRKTLWKSDEIPYGGPSAFVMELDSGRVRLAGRECGTFPRPLPGRRFCWRFRLDHAGGRAHRLTGHYLPGGDRVVDQAYYQGEDYVDYEAETEGDRRQILALIQELGAAGPVLDVGCATGDLLAELGRTGLAAFGLDISEWALAAAERKVGPGKAFACDLDHAPIPQEIVQEAPFGTLVVWATLEHFADPFGVIGRLSELIRPGGHLLIMTSNADGISRFLFGADDWEGAFDWTHRGVEKVGVKSLREHLPQLGWEVIRLKTYQFWNRNADPTCAALRDCCSDHRFLKLLEERDIGDFVLCVAVKR